MEEREIHLKDYWLAVRRRRNTVLAFFVVLLVSVIIFSFTSTPIYQANCDILIQRDNPEGVNLVPMQRLSYASAMEFYPTQYEIIRSEAVARRVVRDLSLGDNPAFNPSLAERSVGLFPSLFKFLSGDGAVVKKSDYVRDNEEAALAEIIREGLSVKPVKDSQVTRVIYESHNAGLAAAIANAVARAYIELSLDMKMNASKEAVGWLSRKIEEQRAKLDKSEKALQQYMQEQDIVSIENRDTITPRKIQEVNTQLVEAESRRRELKALVSLLEKGSDDPASVETVPVVMNDPIIRSLRTEEIDISKKIREMSEKYGPKHPRMVQIMTDRSSVTKRKKEEIKRVLASVKDDLEFASAREITFRDLLEETRAEAHVLSEKSIQYNVLKRNVLSNQQIYDALLKRINEISVTGDVRASNITVIDPARTPKVPIRPRKARNILIAVLVGLFGGVGIALFLDYLDNTVRTPEDVEIRLGLPFLGLVPNVKEAKAEDAISQVVINKPTSPISETYRAIRTGLLLSLPGDKRLKTVLITSFVSEEGKTTTAVNLASVMAHAGKRVLLLDADMRKPQIHSIFGLDNSAGLSVCIAEPDMEPSPLPTELPGLDVLPAGPIPPNPSELLGSSRTRKILEHLSNNYDRVIIDSPPMLPVTDASVLSSLVDAVLLVLRSGKTTFETAHMGVRILKKSDARIAGTVLNAVRVSRDGYGGHHYYHYYSYGSYGYGSAREES